MSERRVSAPRMRGYEVALVEGLSETGSRCLADRVGTRAVLVITTPTVAKLYTRTIYETLRKRNGTASLMVLNCSESTKAIDQVVSVCDEALRCGLDRRAVLVGVGGGVCTDIVTMAASWIRRGIDYIKVPTTLIGLVDAGIGIKGAVNFKGKKSYIGCFYPPHSVLLDPDFVFTLPPRHIRSGLAEIIKTGLACDRHLFELVERHGGRFLARTPSRGGRFVRETVWRSTLRLLDDLEQNLHEDQTQERLADLGHTFSPALEAASGFEMAHGEAVAADMALSAVLATRLALLAPASRDRILSTIMDVGLPVFAPLLTADLCRHALEEAALHRGGRPNLVLPVDIGETTFIRSLRDLSAHDLETSLRVLQEISREGMDRSRNRGPAA